MTDLLPCPSCGEQDVDQDEDCLHYWVSCPECYMQGPYHAVRSEAARLWNALPRADRKLPTTTEGTSDRVMLAGLAMQGILASDGERSLSYQLAIELAVSTADALLAELAKGEP